jgi:hypothetical protein
MQLPCLYGLLLSPNPSHSSSAAHLGGRGQRGHPQTRCVDLQASCRVRDLHACNCWLVNRQRKSKRLRNRLVRHCGYEVGNRHEVPLLSIMQDVHGDTCRCGHRRNRHGQGSSPSSCVGPMPPLVNTKPLGPTRSSAASSVRLMSARSSGMKDTRKRSTPRLCSSLARKGVLVSTMDPARISSPVVHGGCGARTLRGRGWASGLLQC